MNIKYVCAFHAYDRVFFMLCFSFHETHYWVPKYPNINVFKCLTEPHCRCFVNTFLYLRANVEIWKLTLPTNYCSRMFLAQTPYKAVQCLMPVLYSLKVFIKLPI